MGKLVEGKIFKEKNIEGTKGKTKRERDRG
jgi:hypothetical protein